MFWYNSGRNRLYKHYYENLLEDFARQISIELLDMYLRGVPTDKTFDELVAQRLPPHFSKHQTDIASLTNHILHEKGYCRTFTPGKFLETEEEHQREQKQYWQKRVDRQRLTPRAQTITKEIIAHYWQNGAGDANFAEVFYPYAQDATPDEYHFLLEYVIESIPASGYTIHSLAPFRISLTFYNTHKPDPPKPQPPANPLRALLTKLLG